LIAEQIARWRDSPFAALGDTPWAITQRLDAHVTALLPALDSDYAIEGDVARHRTATVERGALVKGPAIIGPRCFVAAGALLRGGTWLDADCIIGPGAELKTAILMRGTKLAHFNFVGDSIVGEDVNFEAGSIVANYRNEMADKRIRIGAIDTGVDKFGALIGDHARIGCNAVIAPGAIIERRQIVRRLALIDQHPDAVQGL
jgi:NDP-sugar pyrophosphorylase family protein